MNIINKLISVGIVFTFMGVFSPAVVQSEEVPLRGPASFATYDKDGSGSISEAEFNAAHKERMAARAADGRPMRGAANPPSFSDFDTNGDGQLNQDELTAGQKARKAERQGAAKGQGCCGGQGGCKGCCGGGMDKGMMKGCCGGGMGKGMMKGCKMNMSKTRHHYVMQNGIDKRYVDKTNTLQNSAGNIKVGKRLYEQNCASCHGPSGQGDGEAGKGLNPRATNIAMFSKMPMASDGYLLWTVAEGGAPLQTAMPAFKNKLTADDIWKIVIYLRQL